MAPGTQRQCWLMPGLLMISALLKKQKCEVELWKLETLTPGSNQTQEALHPGQTFRMAWIQMICRQESHLTKCQHQGFGILHPSLHSGWHHFVHTKSCLITEAHGTTMV